MSNFHPQYIGGYHDQGNPPYPPPTYPTQYIQTDKDHTVRGQPNGALNYDAYGYNMAMPAFNPVGVPSVPPVPIFQGWNQDSMPLPPYTAPANPTSYSGYSSTSRHNSSYYPPTNQARYHQPLATAPVSYDQRELSEGEFDERVSTTITPPAGYSAPQYRGNEGLGYREDAQNATYSNTHTSNSRQAPYTVNNHNSPPEQRSRQRSDSYSPHISPREDNIVHFRANPFPEQNVPDHASGGVSGTIRQENGQLPNSSGSNAQTKILANGNTSQAAQDSIQVAGFKTPLRDISNVTNNRAEAEARRNAQGAILSLLPYEIRYQTYLDEGFREETISRLFDDLKLLRASGNVSHELRPEKAQQNWRTSSGNFKLPQNGQPNIFSGISRQSKVGGLDGESDVTNVSSISSSDNPLHNPNQPTSGTTTVASFPEAAAALSDKERTIQAKMDALRKSREERAQKAAAKKGVKVALTATPVVVSQPEKQRSLEPNQELASNSESLSSTVRLRSPELAAQPNAVAEPRHPISQSLPPQATPNIPGLFLTSSTSSPTPLTNTQSTMVASTYSNPRKRPVAADFDNSFTAPVKRPFGHSSVDDALVIDVSEDEESDDEDVAMDLDSEANQDSPIQPTRSLSDLYSSTAHNLPQLANFPKRRMESPNSSATNTPPIPAVALRPTSTRPADLQRKESEIEELKRRIAQAEARNKARQTPSGTRTPVSSHLTTVESVNTSGINTTFFRNTDTSNTLHSIPAPAKVQINTSDQITSSDQPTILEKPAKMDISQDDSELLRLEELARNEVVIRTSEVAQHQRKVGEMKAELARIEAAAQEAAEKLEQAKERDLRFQQEKELRLQRQNQIMQETSKAAVTLPLQSRDAGEEEDDMIAQSPAIANGNLPMRPVSAHSNAAIQVFTNGQIPSPSQSPIPSYATVKQAIVPPSNDIRDATTSNETQLTDAVADPEPANENIPPDLALEGALEEIVRAETDSRSLLEPRVDIEMSYAPDPTELAPESPEVEEQSVPPQPSHGDDVTDLIEDKDDDYEPPEATPPVDSPPFSPAPPNEDGLLQFDDLMEDIAPSISDNISRELIEEESGHGALPVQNGSAPLSEVPKEVSSLQYFTPYESPLRRFRAYRFHPHFKTDVPGGLRSLTYSHRIDPTMELCRYELAGGICNDTTCDSLHFKDIGLKDDAILTSLGSPDQFKESRHVEFCDGLKEVLMGLRKRKIRDFYIIASEILAYRARFLGDDSKILPLEGVSI